MVAVDYEGIQLLLKANSKDVIINLLDIAFAHRNQKKIPNQILSKTADTLGIEQEEASKALCGLVSLVKIILFQGLSTQTEIIALFPDSFHNNLKGLLTKQIVEKLTEWRNRVGTEQVSLPRLTEFDWRIDLKTASENVPRMAVPTCLLQMKVQDSTSHLEEAPQLSAVTVELSKETLETMLDGLGKIRDQLSVVAERTK